MSLREAYRNLVTSVHEDHPLRMLEQVAYRLGGHVLALLPPGSTSEGARLVPFAARQHAISSTQKCRTLDEAEKILEGFVDCFGVIRLSQGETWSQDVFTGHSWPLSRKFQVSELCDVHTLDDVKVPYELSRCHHFVVLAKAYRLSDDKRYLTALIDLWTSWMKSNPAGRSVNWTSAMEVAIRAANWIMALELGNQYGDLTSDLQQDLTKSLCQHGQYIWRHLESYRPRYSTNHYLANLVGLIYISSVLKNYPPVAKWNRFAVSELFDQVRTQFLPSGPHYELSTSYHRFTTEMVLCALIRLRHLEITIPADIVHRMKAALGYVASYTYPNGKAPQVGDNDDGRLHILGKYLGWERNDHRHLLALGHVFFKDPEFSVRERDAYEDACWLLGAPAEQSQRRSFSKEIPGNAADPSSGSTSFPEAGMYIMRCGTDMSVIKTSNLGLFGTAGYHNHNDVLSFELVLDGNRFIADPGTGQYTGNTRVRNLFRSSRMHSTVIVDGLEQNTLPAAEDLGGVWDLGNEAVAELHFWHTDAVKDVLEASHTGYTRLKDPVVHHRRFIFDKSAHEFEITDTFECQEPESHQFSWAFVLDPAVRAELSDRPGVDLCSGSVRARLTAPFPLSIEPTDFSPSYRKAVPTYVLRGTCRGGASRFVFSIRLERATT